MSQRFVLVLYYWVVEYEGILGGAWKPHFKPYMIEDQIKLISSYWYETWKQEGMYTGSSHLGFSLDEETMHLYFLKPLFIVD